MTLVRQPLVFALLPERLGEPLYYRWYCPAPAAWDHLFAAAPLKYAPGMTMALVPSDVAHGCIALTGFVELRLTRLVAELARTGGLLVDVGANAGYFCLLWTAARPTNTAVAFEPAPRNVGLLRRNLEHNGVAQRVRVDTRAGGRASGAVAFDLGPAEQTGWGGLVPNDEATGGRATLEVEVVRLDEVLGDERIAVLKVDTEGADTWVLEGAEKLLRKHEIGRIFFEQNRPRLAALGIREADAVDLLASAGYDARPLSDPRGDVVEWEAWPR